jgi:ATP-binding cassette, subfamily B, bacterial
VLNRLRARPEWKFFGVLFHASPRLATAWWVLLTLRAAMPALLAVATGVLIAAVQGGSSLTGPLTFVGVVFVAFQVLTPVQQAVSANLGAVASDWMNDRMMVASVTPPGMGHLESSQLADDLTMARDFDMGYTGPPLVIAMDFISSGLVLLVTGLASAIVLAAFTWWAPLVLLGAWGSTHWLLRESGVWRDRNTKPVRDAQRHADYAYRLATDPPAAKELRLFGLADWVVDRFTDRRRTLFELQYEATRLREQSGVGALALVLAANGLVFWALADSVSDGRTGLGGATTFLQTAVGVSAIAFGGLSWALDGAAAPAAAVLRLPEQMAVAGALATGSRPAAGLPAREIRFRDVTFAYDTSNRPVLDHFDLTIPAGTSMAIVGVNGAGKTTLAKLLCRLYDPQGGAVEIDGVDVRELDVAAYRSRIAAVFQDYVRYELPLRDNVAPRGAPDDVVEGALRAAGGHGLADLDTILARGYEGGTELSGGQWQRVALARALAAVELGAGVVLLDEPTAQLDVRGEAEIFARILAATRHCTTVLISHRFSTVRLADRICVLEAGRLVELGSHDELMALDGRYRTMFDLQASRFTEVDELGEEVVHDTLD